MTTTERAITVITANRVDASESAWVTRLKRASSQTRVLVFAALLALLGAFLLASTSGFDVHPPRAWSLPFFALAIAFGVAEATSPGFNKCNSDKGSANSGCQCRGVGFCPCWFFDLVSESHHTTA